ncbi:hypothetical protein K435DRAFT_695711, partial [Dendrothele bispora CBS 962.96]
FGLETKTLGVAMDNASNNDKMLSHIPEHLPTNSLIGSTTQIRCFGHILELSAKAFVTVFDVKSIEDMVNPGGNDGNDGDNSDKVVDAVDVVKDPFLEVADDEVYIDERAELADRNRANEEEIELLSQNLDEVCALTEEDKRMGCGTISKVSRLPSIRSFIVY